MERFAGTVERLCAVDATKLFDWARSIPFEDWPQQRRLADDKIRPSMLVVGAAADGVVGTVMLFFPGCRDHDRLLSVVMAGHWIDQHRDDKGPDWVCRIHVPLTTNSAAVMSMDDGDHHMPVGSAYKVNILGEHAIRNEGETDRLHFMFDVMR